eukprot:4055881-Amphidinium_carterae.1
MDLPAGGYTLLRLISGFESFDPATETLLMLKGGFGLKDAPRLWTMKVDKVFRSEGLFPLMGDEKLYALHKSSSKGAKDLTLLVSAHMDDFKAAADPATQEWFHTMLKKHFGSDVKKE